MFPAFKIRPTMTSIVFQQPVLGTGHRVYQFLSLYVQVLLLSRKSIPLVLKQSSSPDVLHQEEVKGDTNHSLFFLGVVQ